MLTPQFVLAQPLLSFGSVCSGIEAASVAWAPLGWKAAWLAEIEPFPSAVLAHHYPTVPNLGDMTALPERIRAGEVAAPDLFCGGTPCQAFSIAGLRQSLADSRGNLSLTFCEIANAIDDVRLARGDAECIVFWENVPGVLSTSDNAFGCFLGALAGTDTPIVPRGGRWTNAGVVDGPQRTVAWRVLDAQYFGVAQRRRRVFVVASARNGFDPAEVLFEFDGLRRDTAPSREAGQGAAAGTLRSTDGGSDVDHARAGHLTAFGGNNTGGPIEQAAALNANRGCHNPGDFEAGTLLVQQADGRPCAYCGYQFDHDKLGRYGCPNCNGEGLGVTHSLRGEGFDASEDGTGRGTPLVPVAVGADTYNGAITGDVAATLGTQSGDGVSSGPSVMVPVAFDTTQITSKANYSNPQPGDPCHPLATGAHALAIAFPANLSGTQHASTENLAPAMGAKNPTAVAHVELMPTMTAGGPSDTSHNQVSGQMRDAYMVPTTAMQVRRLTPTECERLQGFPDGYTAIPWRGKPADQCPDGPRYKALGNSWAVPNVRWIGQRIAAELAKSSDYQERRAVA